MIKQWFSTKGPLLIGMNKSSNGSTNYVKTYRSLIQFMNLHSSSGMKIIKLLMVSVTG